MDIKDINEWNSAYGLSKTLLKNFVVGIIVLLILSNVFLVRALMKANEKRINRVEQINNELKKERRKSDSLNMEMWKQFYLIKTRMDK